MATNDTRPTPGTCFACHCTEQHACEGGCYWIDINQTLCSVCSHRVVWLANMSPAECIEDLRELEHGLAVRLLALRAMHQERVGFLQLREATIGVISPSEQLEHVQRAFALLGAPRKLYQAPAVLESGGFERIVLTCTHLPTGQGNCHPGSTRS
jgi:hypothetical protein